MTYAVHEDRIGAPCEHVESCGDCPECLCLCHAMNEARSLAKDVGVAYVRWALPEQQQQQRVVAWTRVGAGWPAARHWWRLQLSCGHLGAAVRDGGYTGRAARLQRANCWTCAGVG